MVSSRRIAREWALKILYVMDVGKVPLAEARDTALERLRHEFVLRGSRTASGSRAEQDCLEVATAALRDGLTTMHSTLEQAIALSLGRVFSEAAYWQEVRAEKTLRSRMLGALEMPRLRAPLPDFLAAATREGASDVLAAPLSELTAEERAYLKSFVEQMQTEIPRLLEPEIRKTALAWAKDVVEHHPLGASPEVLRLYLQERFTDLLATSEARWQKVGQTAQKQTTDWLRVAAFTVRLVEGVNNQQAEIDSAVSALSSGWKLERQVSVDRNILRMAVFEMLSLPTIPTSVSINEAVELAKKYSTAESSRFVNGILGALAAQAGADRAQEDLENEPEDSVDIADITELEDTDTE